MKNNRPPATVTSSNNSDQCPLQGQLALVSDDGRMQVCHEKLFWGIKSNQIK